MFFDARDYAPRARALGGLVRRYPSRRGRSCCRRAYCYSDQLLCAEAELRIIVERDPVEQYARLMLGRTQERQGAHRGGPVPYALRQMVAVPGRI
ncbi:hypothetical protein OHA03_42680 [Streptomyces sp. NBC_00154]|nr:hypothetical protein [Streptomyces sp. NBC_00154]